LKLQPPLSSRSQLLVDLLKSKILVLDGAMGTALQDLNLTAADFGGEALDGCNENLVLTRPEMIAQIHKDYLEAGCDIIETNTFGGTPLVLEEFGLGSKTHEINFQAAQIARKAADRHSSKNKPRFVAGSIGPTTKAISVTGGITFDELIENFYAQTKALLDGGVDYFLLETCQDTRNIKAALLAMDALFEKEGRRVPVAVSGTIEPMGTMLAGQSVEALLASLAHRDLLYIGLNCATGPEFMTDHVRSLASFSPFPIACVPNAGLPDEDGQYLESPPMLCKVIERFLQEGWVNLLGGCCGTTPAHIEALSLLAQKHNPRVATVSRSSYLSGVDFLEITDEMRPILVGERTNSIGSRKFKRLIAEEKYEEASEIARAQVKTGAQIIDICLANPDRNELEDIERFLSFLVQKIRVPLMIDSTDAEVIKRSLTYSQGKAIINSVNLEDGEERFELIAPLARQHGAALVVGTIDDDPEQGMGVSRERKLEIAKRSHRLLTEKYGIPPEDIYWDPLVFPCGTGDENYIGSAIETIEGIRLIKDAFPKTKTVLGISNVSFGLPQAGREILNSVFLYHCVQAGLDLAIVNSEKLERFAQISEEERELSENLLFNRGDDPVAAFAAHFREKAPKRLQNKQELPLQERLSNYILQGSKDGLKEDLDEALKSARPLDIINGPLMKGMDEVGRLFNQNKLIVAEVLQSAEAMKAAVAHLEPHMDKNDTENKKGKVLLATVKGDVHDIGKNLVEIILGNNGFEVINLGIKIPSEQLIRAVREHQPDIIGLSGLLVKSAQQMVITAGDFKEANIQLPLLVGGAALSENFVHRKISKAYDGGTAIYAKDAMNGLDLAKIIMNPEKFETFKKELSQKTKEIEEKGKTKIKLDIPQTTETRSTAIELIASPPQPTDFENHILRNTPIERVWSYINPLMLYGRHLGMKGKIARQLDALFHHPKLRTKLRDEIAQQDSKALEIWDEVEKIKKEYKNTELLRIGAVYEFFRAKSKGNKIQLFKGTSLDQKQVAEFTFPRQRKENGLCLSDYTHPDAETQDNICLFTVTAGKGIREHADELKDKGDYLKSHIIQALAIETAEAYAELLHGEIRKIWGLPDPLGMTMMQRFQAKYHGKRYSFGYPACPRLDDQRILFDLIQPEKIGIQLTEGFMMDPESSVSAIVFHHPQAVYFSVGNVDEENENRTS
jgi:5-methyltetrahydrofolate--homocysteine methyltransferase